MAAGEYSRPWGDQRTAYLSLKIAALGMLTLSSRIFGPLSSGYAGARRRAVTRAGGLGCSIVSAPRKAFRGPHAMSSPYTTTMLF
jgi:hypothetical protein